MLTIQDPETQVEALTLIGQKLISLARSKDVDTVHLTLLQLEHGLLETLDNVDDFHPSEWREWLGLADNDQICTE